LWCYRFHPTGFLVGVAVNNGGLLLDWARRLVLPSEPPTDALQRLLDDAAKVSVGAAGVRLEPSLLGPECDPAVVGGDASITGVRDEHGPPELTRAAVDALVLSLVELTRRLEAAGPAPTDLTIAGLPAIHPALAQATCDGLGRPVRVVRLADASAVGAAVLGHEALEGRRPTVAIDTWALTPDPEAAAAYAALLADRSS
jgi:gluconokinase